MARGHEPDQYTAAETARLSVLVGRLALGGNQARIGRAIGKLQEGALAREEAEREVKAERAAEQRKARARKRR